MGTEPARFRCSVLLLLLTLGSGCASAPRATQRPAAVPAWDAGFLAARDQTLLGDARLRAAGPLYEAQTATNGMAFSAVRPFYSSVTDPYRDRELRDYVWPLGHVKNTQAEREWHCLLAYGIDWDRDDPQSRYRFWLMPLAFSGRDREGERYHALFPVGGNLHEFMGRDRITFVLWPIYAHAKTGDLDTHHVVWPIVSWSRGDTEHGYRVFPLYGRFTDEGRLSKRFLLWPIWTSVHYDHAAEKGDGYILFPLYGRVKTDKQKGWMVLPPFFRWSQHGEFTQANLPWPFVHYTRSPTVNRTYIWPLYGERSDKHASKRYYLWPIARMDRLDRADGAFRQGRVLPFIYYDSLRTPTNLPSAATNRLTGAQAEAAPAVPPDAAPGSVRARYFKLWPLFTYRREDARSVFGTLALWPLKQSPAVERNWAPLWTLFSIKRDGAAREEELLWGLWRRRAGADGSRQVGLFPLFESARAADPATYRRWSLLSGLCGVEREGLKKRVRLLYFVTLESTPTPAVPVPVETDAGSAVLPGETEQ